MSNHASFSAATFNPKGQTLEALNQVVAQITKIAGCGHCGRVMRLRVEFLGDPPPDLSKDHVISFETGALGG
jgi:hypothetical protein